MYFVYELFDKTIQVNPQSRYPNALELLSALDGVIMRIEQKAHVLNPNVRQPCLFCVIGEYRPAVGGTTNELMLVCANCGNIQKFTGAPHSQWWERK